MSLASKEGCLGCFACVLHPTANRYTTACVPDQSHLSMRSPAALLQACCTAVGDLARAAQYFHRRALRSLPMWLTFTDQLYAVVVYTAFAVTVENTMQYSPVATRNFLHAPSVVFPHSTRQTFARLMRSVLASYTVPHLVLSH